MLSEQSSGRFSKEKRAFVSVRSEMKHKNLEKPFIVRKTMEGLVVWLKHFF